MPPAKKQPSEPQPQLDLLYPFYLDTDMSMAFAAALGGGVALEREETSRDEHESQAVRNLRGNLRLFSGLGIDAGRDKSQSDSTGSEARLVLRHTEASIFIALHDELRRTGRLVDDPDIEALDGAADALISLRAGPAIAPLRRVVDQILRLLDVAAPLVGLESMEQGPATDTRQQRRQQARELAKQAASDPDSPQAALRSLRGILIALKEDLDRSGMVDVVITRESQPAVVLTLDERFLRDEAMELLHTSTFTVIGRVTHTWQTEADVLNLLRRSVLSLVPAVGQAVVWGIFTLLVLLGKSVDPADARLAAMMAAGMESSERPEPSEVMLGDDVAALNPAVTGPAIQILPLAICA